MSPLEKDVKKRSPALYARVKRQQKLGVWHCYGQTKRGACGSTRLRRRGEASPVVRCRGRKKPLKCVVRRGFQQVLLVVRRKR